MYKLVRIGRLRLLNVMAEAALIVFSISLALYSSHFREEREGRQRLDAGLQAVRTELMDNRAILRDIIPYHESERTRISKYLLSPKIKKQIKGHSLADLTDDLMPRGVWNPKTTPQDLSDAAWRSVLSGSNVSIMDQAELKALTSYYLEQSDYLQTLHSVEQQWVLLPMYDPNETLVTIRMSQGWFDELAAEEQNLLANLDHTLRTASSARAQ